MITLCDSCTPSCAFYLVLLFEGSSYSFRRALGVDTIWGWLLFRVQLLFDTCLHSIKFINTVVNILKFQCLAKVMHDLHPLYSLLSAMTTGLWSAVWPTQGTANLEHRMLLSNHNQNATCTTQPHSYRTFSLVHPHVPYYMKTYSTTLLIWSAVWPTQGTTISTHQVNRRVCVGGGSEADVEK